MIGEVIKDFRTNLKFTNAQISKETGITPSYLSQIESEKKIPSPETFFKIIKYLSSISPINDLNKKELLTKELYKNWREKATIDIDDVDGTTELYSPSERYIKSFNNNSVTNNDLEKTFEDYFFEESYQYYEEVPLNLFAKRLPLFDDIKEMEDVVEKWWYNYYLNKTQLKLSNSINLTPAEDKILTAVKLSLDEGTNIFEDNIINISKEILKGKNVIFDLSLLSFERISLTVDNKVLTSEEIKALELLVEGIRTRH